MSIATPDAARDLERAPIVSVVDDDFIEAASRAEAWARWLLALPPALSVTWVAHRGGYRGQLLGDADGQCEVRLNAAEITSPWDAAYVAVHEFKHAADHHAGWLASMSDEEAESRANLFASEAMRHVDVHDLSRRPSRAAMRGDCEMTYEEFIKMGGVSGNLRGARASALLQAHRAQQADARRAAPLPAGEVRCRGCSAAGFRIGVGRFRCRGCGRILDLMGAALG